MIGFGINTNTIDLIIMQINFIILDASLNDSKNSTQIDFDALAFVRCSMGANQLYEIVLKSIDRNIACIEASVTNVDRPLHTFVFCPNILGHFIIFVYPTKSADDGKNNKSGTRFFDNIFQ